MVHVFNERTQVFVQKHYTQVAQSNSKAVHKNKRQREYVKYLLALEKRNPVKCIYLEKKDN